MILVAGGDSFVFGSELKDQLDGASQSTYSALLAKQHNMEYNCVAWPGNANNAISRMVINACEQYKTQNRDIGVIVTWTFTSRYEFRFNYNTKQKITPWYSINAWSVLDDPKKIADEFKSKNDSVFNAHIDNLRTANTTGVSNFAKVFFKHVGDSEYYELYSSLREILFLQFYLEQNNIPYLFTAADNHFYDCPNYYRQQDENIDSLYSQIKWDKWFFFNPGSELNETKTPRGFYQWAVENKYPIGTTHPLEEAHTAAAKLIKEKFNEMVTKSLEQNKIRN
jgi:hypothetical protein